VPAALEVITGQATNPGVGPVALTPNSGDSFSVRATDISADIELWNAWAFTNTNLLLRIRSPRMHDQSQNIRLQPVAATPRPLIGLQPSQKLYSQDNIIAEISGGAAEVDGASLLVYYRDLPGISSRLYPWSQVEPLIQNLTSVEVDPISSATAFNYGAALALNSLFDTLIRNVDYAVLGYECSTVGCTVGLRGADTGNLRIGGPLYNQTEVTASWFVNLSQANSNAPVIPIINAANVGAILCDVAAQAVSTTFKVSWNLAQLKSPLGRTTS
jgi:hypothetical protein